MFQKRLLSWIALIASFIVLLPLLVQVLYVLAIGVVIILGILIAYRFVKNMIPVFRK
jgi:hypothetical protein